MALEEVVVVEAVGAARQLTRSHLPAQALDGMAEEVAVEVVHPSRPHPPSHRRNQAKVHEEARPI